MSILPCENLLLRTNLPLEEVSRRLHEVIGPPRGVNPLAGRSEPYLGAFEGARFRVSPQFTFSNPLRPVIVGEIVALGSGSYVHLIMRPAIGALIFIGIWLFTAAAALVDILVSAILGEAGLSQFLTETTPQLVLSVLFFVGAYVLIVAEFKRESAKSKAFFANLVESRRIEKLGTPSAKEAA